MLVPGGAVNKADIHIFCGSVFHNCFAQTRAGNCQINILKLGKNAAECDINSCVVQNDRFSVQTVWERRGEILSNRTAEIQAQKVVQRGFTSGEHAAFRYDNSRIFMKDQWVRAIIEVDHRFLISCLGRRTGYQG